MNEVVNCAAYSEGRRIANVELDVVHEVLKETDQFVWIGLQEPTEEVLNRVQEEFGLHELAVEDARNAHQRPKVELYGDSVFVVLRTVQMNQDHHVEFGETHFFVGENFIVTIRHAGEEVVSRNAALIRDDGRAETEARSRIVGVRIVVGNRTANGATIAHLRVAD